MSGRPYEKSERPLRLAGEDGGGLRARVVFSPATSLEPPSGRSEQQKPPRACSRGPLEAGIHQRVANAPSPECLESGILTQPSPWARFRLNGPASDVSIWSQITSI